MASVITFAVPAIPLGFDSGLPEDNLDYFDSFLSTDDQDMTTDPLVFVSDDQSPLYHWSIESPIHQSQPSSNPARSPGAPRNLQHPAASPVASSSRSPTSLILTPASTLLDYPGDASYDGSDEVLISPTSNSSHPADEFVYLPNIDGSGPASMNPNRLLHDGRRLPTPLLQRSGIVSGVHSSSSQSRASSVAVSDSITQAQWPQSTSGAWMIDHHAASTFRSYDNIPMPYALMDEHVAAPSFSVGLLSGTDAMADGSSNAYLSYPTFRPLTPGEEMLLIHGSMSHPESSPFQFPAAQSEVQSTAHPRHASHPIVPSSSQHLTGLEHVEDQSNEPLRISRSVPVVPSQAIREFQSRNPDISENMSSAASAAESDIPIPKTRRTTKSRAVASGGRASARSRTAGTVPSSSQIPAARGGRRPNTHLTEPQRKKTMRMRKAVACWRCVLQRDPCPDEGTPCARCVGKSQKGPISFFPCCRIKLGELKHDFLPPSMTFMHSRQAIEDTVKSQVLTWHTKDSLDVYFTCGFGPALRWQLYEFEPKTRELLGQLQYLQTSPGTSVRVRKYSPPFALLKLDSSDEQHFEDYMDTLLSEDYISDFAWTCFEEETEFDDFQARLLDWMCNTYQDSEQDYDLRELLRKILRMMLITYIMGHTLTIVDETLMGVLNSVKHSPRGAITQHTSPRLANRQLKFFFSNMREALYVEVLNWLQQTLHSSGRKEATWLSSFCVIIGLSLVLEELQRTLFVQADAKCTKGEMSYEAAHSEAMNACERIDSRHQLLVGLFQCKYRDKGWKLGSFGSGTPDFKKASQRKHLQTLFQLVVEKQTHLEARKAVTLHEENQCLFTSRLVAPFLLPFLQPSQ